MSTLELPKSFDDFVDARKAGFLKVKEFVENGGHLVGMFCSYRFILNITDYAYYERMKKHEHIRITKII